MTATATRKHTALRPRTKNIFTGISGLSSAIVTLAVAEVLALFLAPASSPVLAVGSFVIDIVPPWVKETAIALFGTGDKIALLAGLGLGVLVLAVAIGVLQYRRPPFGLVGLGLVGLLATIAVITRAGSTPLWVVPTIVGTVLGILILRATTTRFRAWADAAADDRTNRWGESAASYNRRSFLQLVGVATGAALVAGLAARAVNSATAAVNTVRESITLPKPSTPAPDIAPGTDLGIDGVAPYISANDGFYRIDTALQIPIIDPADWSLKITGMVEKEIEITYADLQALPLVENVVTLTCVSNEVGGTLIGNAVWLGYPIRELLAKAVPAAGADMVLSSSADGWTASTPLEVLQDENRDSILAIGMNGAPLPLEHGFPVRMVVAGLYGYVSATKWVTELKVTRFADETSYWTDRGWSDHGPIKTSSRIDVPLAGRQVAAGKVAVAGVAWAQHVGVTKVEVRVDRGRWNEAKLAEVVSVDTWVQWVWEWQATKGNHTLEVRATDAAGKTQGSALVDVVPNGAEGWHTIDVSVA